MKDTEFYVDKGFVRGGFYDEMGGMLVGVRSQEVCDKLNGYAELEAAVDKVLSRTTSMPEDMKKLYGIDALELTKEEL